MSSDTPPASMAADHRKYGTIELFEQYWVRGQSLDSMGNGAFHCMKQRGIPTRSQSDAQQYHNGDVSLQDLWDKYLTDFQIKVAQELQSLTVRTQHTE